MAAIGTHGLSLKPGWRAGLFGGSFNPAHEGHLHVAEAALERLRLDRVVWLVSPQNPLKAGQESMTLRGRLEGVRRLARDPRMIVSDFESRAGSPYTIDTIGTLKAAFPEVDFVWVMGSDNLKGFHRWRDWRSIARALPIAVVARPGSALAGRRSIFGRRFADSEVDERYAARLPDMSPPAWTFIHAGWNFASSTEIRSRLRGAAD
jgi:nicotinate-nucleotide adenylyltransferase